MKGPIPSAAIMKKVINNVDPFKAGRVQLETGEWVYPIVSDVDSEEFNVPAIGDLVLTNGEFYVVDSKL